MEECIKKEYISFIQKQLAEMAKTVKKNSSKNQAKRENNIFFIFSDKNAKKYMGTGRSFDSQLGTRLQKIAMFISRRKYGSECVPNLIVLYNVGASIKVSTISYPLRNGMSQKVYWTNKPVEDFLNKKLRKLFDNKSEKICIKTFKVECESQVIEKIKKEFDKRDAKGNGIPIDLFVLNQVDDS